MSDGEFFASVIATVLLVASGIAIPAAYIDRYACLSKWEQSGREAKWGVFTGCLINVDGNWVPSANYREL